MTPPHIDGQVVTLFNFNGMTSSSIARSLHGMLIMLKIMVGGALPSSL